MNTYDVLHGPVTPDSYRVREHYRIQGNIAAGRREAQDADLRQRVKTLEEENAKLRTQLSSSNAHALAEERSDDSQQRVVGGKVDA
jgi:hypothetical protein